MPKPPPSPAPTGPGAYGDAAPWAPGDIHTKPKEVEESVAEMYKSPCFKVSSPAALLLLLHPESALGMFACIMLLLVQVHCRGAWVLACSAQPAAQAHHAMQPACVRSHPASSASWRNSQCRINASLRAWTWHSTRLAART
jgi:hypothetical protein